MPSNKKKHHETKSPILVGETAAVPAASSASSALLAEQSSTALETLAIELGGQLASAGLMLVTAESCTGGMIAAAVTDISGSSAWFERGFVTYSNEAKSTAIGVSPAMIDSFGAVSEEVAAAMAVGALAKSAAQVAVAVTGIAGPGGGTASKPVGMVCFGWCRQHEAPITETRHFTGDRAAVRHQATIHAMQGVRRLLATDTTKSAAVQAP